MDMPIIVLLLQGIPEQIGIATLACALARIPFRWKELILMGILLAVSAYFLRLSNLPFGSHTIALVVLLFIFLTWRGKKDISLALLYALVSYVFLIVFEAISIGILMSVLDISPEKMFSEPYIRILFTEPQVILLFITAFFIRRKRGVHD